MEANTKFDFDAIVVGSGPNGLAAAIELQQQGLAVLVVEAKNVVGGGLRTAELTLPGFHHDICSAIHPMAAGSPFLKTLPLADYGLEFINPPMAAAHPFDDGTAAALFGSAEQTGIKLGADCKPYLDLVKPLVRDWKKLAPDLLGPLHFPKYPVKMARFGLRALPSAMQISRKFNTKHARGLFAGMAAHGIQPLSNWATSAIALVLLANGNLGGWPLTKGGSVNIADAMAAYFVALGGKIETGFEVSAMSQLPSAKAVLFDVTPQQLLKIAGHRFSSIYKWQLKKYRYGMGVFKVDWALADVIPFTAPECRNAGTIHLGNTFDEIADAEWQTSKGKIVQNPFILLAQQSNFDKSRAPEGKQTAWAYCHVPNGSTADMTEIIEKQVERFAPGFRERILARHTFNTEQMQEYNPNYIGGDINGGVLDIGQLFTRPALRWSPYQSSDKGIYICSSSTPPGGGVHGMCGYYAAKRALKEVFGLKASALSYN